jgi:hypothetical protein
MQTLNIKHSKRDTIKLIKQAALNIGLGIEKESFVSGRLDLIHNGSFFSFGNKIEVIVSTFDNSKCLIKINSRSSAMLQILDWGTNREIEEQLMMEIQKIVKS